MKGVILAGGAGTRLMPITRIINKHLLPVGPYPMIFWPIKKLLEAAITDILIITNERDLPLFTSLLGGGEELGVNLTYRTQDCGGIGEALYVANTFVKDEKFIVLLGDNIFQDSLAPYIAAFTSQAEGARILLKQVEDPKRFGVALLDKKAQHIMSIVEKPETPVSDYCVTGIYMYGPEVFKYIRLLKPSQRGELEITDVNNYYIKNHSLQFDVLKGWWVDAGTPESLHQSSQYVFRDLMEG